MIKHNPLDFVFAFCGFVLFVFWRCPAWLLAAEAAVFGAIAFT